MGVITRGIKNTFRNATRSVGIIVILALVIALSISMLIGRTAIDNRISQVQAHTGNTLTVTSSAGSTGPFSFARGTPFSASDVTTIQGLAHVASVNGTLRADLTPGTNTGLQAYTPSGITFTNPFGNGGGFGGSGGQTQQFKPGVTVVGTNEPGTSLTNSNLGGSTETLTSGKAYSATSTADVAIVGSSLAALNSLKAGSTFTAWTKTFTVVGIYNAGTSNFANGDVLMPLATVQKLTGDTGEISSAIVTVDTASHLTSVQTAIENALGSTASVQNLNAGVQSNLSELSSTKTTTTYILWGTIIAGAVILLLTMLMIVRERRREIGVLKAIGAPNRSVVGQFVAEASTFTIIGSVTGFLLGLVLANPLTNLLYNSTSNAPANGGFAQRTGGFPGGGGGGPGIGLSRGGFGHALSSLSGSAGWSTVVFAFLIAVAVAAAGSAVASATILRIRPADVLRSE